MSKKSDKKQTIVILDAHAIIHRAYHALPSFANSRGEPTGALYGIVTMLVKILEEFHPDAIVAAYDLPKPTFRHHAYDAYKAGRAKTDDDLAAQIVKSRDIFAAFGIECLDAEGFEADDVIGTLAQSLGDKSRTIIIASGDMDTLQLVRDKHVLVYTLKKGIQDTALYDEDAVIARYGFEPAQLVDYKGLRGDPSDNIIGVPGIGEKTATTLVTTFGTIEKLYKAIDKDDAAFKKTIKDIKLTDRMLGILKEHRDDAFFSKTLATIRTDAPVHFDIPSVSYFETADEGKLVALLEDLEFRSLIPRIRKLFSFAAPVVVDEDPELLLKAAIGLWVLRSDFTTPDRETVLGQMKAATLAEALQKIEEELSKQGTLPIFEHIEVPLMPVIKEMHERGVCIDIAHFEKLRTVFSEKLRDIEEKVFELVGKRINLASPKQLSALLFEDLKLAPKGKKKASGAFTTNAEALESMSDLHPIVPLVLQYRETQKLLTTYVESLLTAVAPDGKVHADFYQNGTTTGRFSSAHPNLQNLPASGEGGKDIRKGFVATEGCTFISCDYSQIELRVLAMLSGDEQLIESFRRGDDIHAAVAALIFSVPQDKVTADMRRSAKVINFGILYGMGISALQKNLGTSREEASRFYENYFAAFPTIAEYLEKTKFDALKHGYTTTMFGRRRYFPTLKSPLPHLRAFAERMASNAPIQGTAADIIKIAIVLIDADLKKHALRDKVHLVLQIHDELVYEVEESVATEAETIIVEAMNKAVDRSPIQVSVPLVPLSVSAGIGNRLDLLK